MRLAEILIALATITGCQNTVMDKKLTSAMATDTSTVKLTDHAPNKKLTYLALGDSYTIGESVNTAESYPYQLVAQLEENKLDVQTPQIIARTGWTTTDLKEAVTAANLTNKYDLVTLLIGVNNQYQGITIDTYHTEFNELLKTAIALAHGGAKHVFVLSIPDYSVTPYAQGSDLNKISAELANYNAIAQIKCKQLGVTFVDITPVSLSAKNNRLLIADDGLHPSGKMYALWVQQLLPKVVASLAKTE